MMIRNNLYVDIHVLQNVPPSCINRDDTGSPKTAKYGGVVRARVSSQAWKHEIRKMFREMFEEDEIGVRTKKVPQMIASEIKKIDSSIKDEEADKLASKALKSAGIKIDGKEEKSAVLIFFSVEQAEAFAQLAIDKCSDKEKYESALAMNPSVDMALFGRMIASTPSLNFDAAAQVAHAISTHAVHNEYDYFTAVDDLDKLGAGHLGTVEFNSSTLYRYATVNVVELQKNLDRSTAKTAKTVKRFIESFIKAMPTGKQNTFANKTLPDFVYITLRTDQPINLVGAFEKPVSGTNGYLEDSEKIFKDYVEKVYRNYACAPEKVWEFGDMDILQILKEVENEINEKLTESEGE